MYDELIEKVKNNSNILEIINSYNIKTTLKDDVYYCICPFHNKPNTHNDGLTMYINEKEQYYKCFKCGATGNVFIFVRDFENISFQKAVKIVEDKQNKINLEKEHKKKPKK